MHNFWSYYIALKFTYILKLIHLILLGLFTIVKAVGSAELHHWFGFS